VIAAATLVAMRDGAMPDEDTPVAASMVEQWPMAAVAITAEAAVASTGVEDSTAAVGPMVVADAVNVSTASESGPAEPICRPFLIAPALYRRWHSC
jgi:hypothetical protein